jgi:DNA-binding beta-propeller fold protein YncE
MWMTRFFGLVVVASLFCGSASGKVLVSANDAAVARIEGAMVMLKDAPSDTLAIIDVSQFPPKTIQEIEVPASVVGPPSAVAVTPDQRLALVVSAEQFSTEVSNFRGTASKLYVVDLTMQPATIISTIEIGPKPTGISINRAGTLALVANRNDGTVSVVSIDGKKVTRLNQVKICKPGCSPATTAFVKNDTMALVTVTNEHKVAMLKIDGTDVTLMPQFIAPGVRPYELRTSPDGKFAVVGSLGWGKVADNDTISIIDLTGDLPRKVGTYGAGLTIEGVAVSPDGKYVAAVAQNASQSKPGSALYNDYGILTLFKVEQNELTKVSSVKIGHWPQGAAFSENGDYVLVQSMMEKEIEVFLVLKDKLIRADSTLKMRGGPASISSF